MTKSCFKVGDKWIGENNPTYFIADIAANHNGDLERAKDIIYLAADSGADAVKFQHFTAPGIVSDYGFKSIGGQFSHQESWKKSIFEVYTDASLPRKWTETLQVTSQNAGVHFFSAPYDFEAVDLLNKIGVPAHKIGSGDITWLEIIDYIGKSGKPVFLASGASSLDDVARAMIALEKHLVPICLMQCNTNYTASMENMKHIHLNVLKTYALLWPEVVLGLSDHTAGHATVLGAVALGAKAIEKHFTDDKSLQGPDHKFSMDPRDWAEMVERTRELEAALGSVHKFVADNEKETVVLQRRCVRAARDLSLGSIVMVEDLEELRPAPIEAVMPYDKSKILNRVLNKDIPAGRHLTFYDFK